MSQNYNWQLGRDMAFPYDAAFPEHQFAFVFNLNRCIGCQSCTMACKSTWTFSRGQENMWWNNVETKPYGGYPHHWDVKTLDLLEQANPAGQTWGGNPEDRRAPYGRFNGKTIFEAAETFLGPEGANRALGYLPADEEWSAPNRYEDHPVANEKGVAGQYFKGGEALPQHKTWFFYLARLCNHCSYPACLAACPRNAIYKRPEDGVVLIDQERCRGYRKCLEACPYKKSLYRGTTRTSEKCIACYPRLEGRDPDGRGLPMQTRCMAACIGHIRLQGLIDLDAQGAWKADRYNPLYYLVHVAKVALPLYPQFGTEPNGYYIPPRWVPRPYLRQMFGPGADAAVDQYAAPDRELLAVLQLFGKDHRICTRYELKPGPKVFETTVQGKPFALYNDTIIGYAKDGSRIVETTVEEPLHLRPALHANSI
ncbi:MAG: 4Fe-4S dicluster domain-containing protein [Verrucomicrobia bacterium]|nr:4Fe-4S dicluster domain-containing protein [Verrucomicrobiota bacterium]